MITRKILFSILTLFSLSAAVMSTEQTSVNLDDPLRAGLLYAHELRQSIKDLSSYSEEGFLGCDVGYNEACEYISDVLSRNFSDIEQDQQQSLLPAWYKMIEDALTSMDTDLLQILASSIAKGWGGHEDILSYDKMRHVASLNFDSLDQMPGTPFNCLVFWDIYTHKNVDIHQQVKICKNLSKWGYQKLAKIFFMQAFIKAKEPYFSVPLAVNLDYKLFILGSAIKKCGIDGFEKDIFDVSHDENISASDKWILAKICQKANMDQDTIIDMCAHVCRSKTSDRNRSSLQSYEYYHDMAITMIRSYGDNYENSISLAQGFYQKYKNSKPVMHVRFGVEIFETSNREWITLL